MEYYIVDEHKLLGPYDLVSVVRKIRNGSVLHNTGIKTLPDGDTTRAIQVPELQTAFHELEQRDQEKGQRRYEALNFFRLLKNGWEFFLQNLSVSAYTGLLVLLGAGGVFFFSIFLTKVPLTVFS